MFWRVSTIQSLYLPLFKRPMPEFMNRTSTFPPFLIWKLVPMTRMRKLRPTTIALPKMLLVLQPIVICSLLFFGHITVLDIVAGMLVRVQTTIVGMHKCALQNDSLHLRGRLRAFKVPTS
jgi:hypothetical protein